MSKLMTMNYIKKGILEYGGRGLLLAKKYSPQILIFGGLVGMGGTIVLSSLATLKAESVIDEFQEKKAKINYAKENVPKEKYSDKDYKTDMTKAYIQTGFEFFKLYTPAITLGITSTVCILAGYNIINKRNVALIAAYKTIEQSFASYRQNVIDELGDEKDRQFTFGKKETTIIDAKTDEDGNVVEEERTISILNSISPYARYFDSSSTQWSPTPDYNLTFLKCTQNYANDILNTKSHIFLNEVYDMLGIPRSKEGQIVGWVKGNRDSYVDFGIFDGENQDKRQFVNGILDSILLDFNVDGIVYDLI